MAYTEAYELLGYRAGSNESAIAQIHYDYEGEYEPYA